MGQLDFRFSIMIHWQSGKRLLIAAWRILPVLAASMAAPEEPFMVNSAEYMEQLSGMAAIRSENVPAFISSCRVSLITVGVAVCSLLLFALLYLCSVALGFNSAGAAWLKPCSVKKLKAIMAKVLKSGSGYHFAPGCMRGRDCISARM